MARKNPKREALDMSLDDYLRLTPEKGKGGGFTWPSFGLGAFFQSKMPERLAFYTILAIATEVDGYVQDEERSELRALCRRTKTLFNIEDAEIDRMHRRIQPRFEKSKMGPLLEQACRSISGEAKRLSVFAHACDLIMADRIIQRSERDYLFQLHRLLGLAEDKAEEMLRVLKIKNAY
jgi:uncharacterized tellurite resistance protein B-like protein